MERPALAEQRDDGGLGGDQRAQVGVVLAAGWRGGGSSRRPPASRAPSGRLGARRRTRRPWDWSRASRPRCRACRSSSSIRAMRSLSARRRRCSRPGCRRGGWCRRARPGPSGGRGAEAGRRGGGGGPAEETSGLGSGAVTGRFLRSVGRIGGRALGRPPQAAAPGGRDEAAAPVILIRATIASAIPTVPTRVQRSATAASRGQRSGGPEAVVQRGRDGRLDRVGDVGSAQRPAQEHGGGEDRPDRVRQVLPRDVGRGAVDRLEEAVQAVRRAPRPHRRRGQHPQGLPASTDASSDRMSPKRFSVTRTSKLAGAARATWRRRRPAGRRARRPGTPAATSWMTCRHRRDVARTLALSTDVSRFRRPRASSKASRTTRPTSSAVYGRVSFAARAPGAPYGSVREPK